ncbi:methyltransferase domain-containing protein [Olivibacter sp. SDN3]|uniref:class I SAM-dependent methyltransferase n=1 Tax=Olivibacter sp. SDN3 TaxID=2764720 RepID=UPI0016513953|nr:methyltransferase domain-containing protein [Olivibacter sp. SDN3]QNL47879.1 methyltransferase domain-containing protein [Olivibacter sp. SDN3]
MEELRSPFQGVKNIICFNWHFFLIATLWLIGLLYLSYYFPIGKTLIYLMVCCTCLSLLTTLIVSHYIYDRSALYKLSWLDGVSINGSGKLANIHAGCDESSALLSFKFTEASIDIFDFYDPQKHTEVSIRRARRSMPSLPGTKTTGTSHLPVADNSYDGIFLILAAHEIRKDSERIIFFGELRRALKPGGKIIVVEHLRNLANFLAYTIGCFHFLPASVWNRTFDGSSLQCTGLLRITPFVNAFILEKR